MAEGDLPRMSPEELAATLETPFPPPILDVRGGAAYAAGSVPGAINAGRQPEGFLPDPRVRRVVLILPPEADAAVAAAWAARLGPDTEVVILDGGFEGWLARGGTIERPGGPYVRPGTIPFTIPRGLCEMNDPAQEFR